MNIACFAKSNTMVEQQLFSYKIKFLISKLGINKVVAFLGEPLCPFFLLTLALSNLPIVVAQPDQARRHGGHSGTVPPQLTACALPNKNCAPPNENCAPPSEDIAPKKWTGSGLLKCKSRPKLVFASGIFFRGLKPDFMAFLGERPFF